MTEEVQTNEIQADLPIKDKSHQLKIVYNYVIKQSNINKDELNELFDDIHAEMIMDAYHVALHNFKYGVGIANMLDDAERIDKNHLIKVNHIVDIQLDGKSLSGVK